MEKIEKYFSDCIFTMKGASVKVAILRFFTRHGPFSHHAKFHLWLRPPSTFFGVFRDSWQILSSKIFLIFFLCKIWVIAAPNKHFLGVWYQKWMRNKLLLLHFFSTFLNPQRTTLTYSAVVIFFLSDVPGLNISEKVGVLVINKRWFRGCPYNM